MRRVIGGYVLNILPKKKGCKVNTGEPADILIEFKDRDPFDCGTIRNFVSF